MLVDSGLNIIAGHGRVLAAEGMPKVPCVFVEHLTEAQKRAYILADNRLAEMAGWDEEKLKIELDALREMDFDIGITGFDDYEFKTPDVAEDNFDIESALEKPPVAKLGDIFYLGRHRIICGDAILDCFLGSASTLIAAEQMGRTCFGVELDPRFVDVAVERFKTVSGEKIFVERDGQRFALESSSIQDSAR